MIQPAKLKQIKSLIAEGDTMGAIQLAMKEVDALSKQEDVKSIYRKLIILSGKLNSLILEKEGGLIVREQYQVDLTKINNSLLSLIDSIEEKASERLINNDPQEDENKAFEFDVFLCFSSKDIEVARVIWEGLTKSGLKVFMSEEALKLEAGVSFTERIAFALENSQNFVYLVSDNALESEWVKIEYETFHNEFYLKNKTERKFIIYNIPGKLSKKVPLFLRRLQYANSIEAIIAALGKNNGQSSPSTPKQATPPEIQKPVEPRREEPSPKQSKQFNDPRSYIVSPELENALNISMSLGQPLLLSGEPGVGKTQFASYVANRFELEPLLTFNVKTNSEVRDLLYRYDAVRYQQYSQANHRLLSNEEIEKMFIDYQALGAAIKSGKRSVVLIDEIDNASRDFSLNLVDSLEKLEFTIYELGMKVSVKPGNIPIIIITTNSEKNLPDSLLQKCVYYHIPFPTQEVLYQIIKSKFDSTTSPEYLQNIIYLFNSIRALPLKKRPSVAELMAWIEVLKIMKVKEEDLSGDSKKIIASLTVLLKTPSDIEMVRAMLY